MKISNARYISALSDLHIGSPSSRYTNHIKSIDRVFQRSTDVVLVGDVFELFYVKQNGIEQPQHAIRRHIDEALTWLEDKLYKHPDTRIHLVLGNHENIKEFREGLDALQRRHAKQFEWHPEAIMLENTLFVHGDLGIGFSGAMHGNDRRRECLNVKSAAEHQRWLPWITRTNKMGHALVYPFKQKGQVQNMDKHLRWAANSMADDGSRYSIRFHVLKDGEEVPFTREVLREVKHVVFGHTHAPHDSKEMNRRRYYNTGSLKRDHCGKDRAAALIFEWNHDGRWKEEPPYVGVKELKPDSHTQVAVITQHQPREELKTASGR